MKKSKVMTISVDEANCKGWLRSKSIFCVRRTYKQSKPPSAMKRGQALLGASDFSGMYRESLAPNNPHQNPIPAPANTSVSQWAPTPIRERPTKAANKKSSNKGLRFSLGLVKKIALATAKAVRVCPEGIEFCKRASPIL